ncbi:aminotransferase class III-fold pyridoxal phosphate-dependent enzyme [Botrimarina hoheduenensis]|uniref:Putrescine aminotransferase n=1 Tax=Botrimarina hoheduenensis TaxID=2528000 RepID=A0A5C5WDR7_9BACT|nr:aspartate aminotransferase family protein [Botrimarina hoheduenensis]TWT47832.1 Putrescine aminotransferase [Botrimarina hoheduenensis]
MDSYPYYLTWSRQADLGAFPVRCAEHDEFVLEDGRRVYDFISTSFQSNYGHSHPLLRKRIHEQLDTMPIASPKASFALKQRVSERLLQKLGLPGGKLFYTTSGSESVENALKMARQFRGATKVLARRESYHGASLGALSVTGDWRNGPHWTVDSETIRIPEPSNDPDLTETHRLVKEAGADSIAAIILETVSGANGVAIPSQGYFDAVQQLCDETGIVLISDEVLCGFGRTGTDFALQAYGLRPDLVCLSKGITGGYVPFGAVYTGPRITGYYQQELLACGLTSYAHPLGLAALDAVLDVMSDPVFQANQRQLETVLAERLRAWSREPWLERYRCKGLLAAIELPGTAPSWRACFDRGLHLFSKGSMLVLGPPLVSHPDRLAAALDTLQELIVASLNDARAPITLQA